MIPCYTCEFRRILPAMGDAPPGVCMKDPESRNVFVVLGTGKGCPLGRSPPPPEQPPAPPERGPGTELRKVLAKLGIKPGPGCKCAAHIHEMDTRGADWCEANVDLIVSWLREEADRQGRTFIELGARVLVRWAIRRAR